MRLTNVMGKIFNIQRFCVNDGPGIRTTVFLKGCMLNCPWCHNPESKNFENQIMYYASKCVGCGKCAVVCSNNCHSLQNGIHSFNFGNCMVCGKCVDVCCGSALDIIGEDCSAEDVIDIVVRDKMFYDTSGGGITISGGEPFYQPEFLFELLINAKEKELHTSIETCGYTTEKNIIKSAEVCDLYLFDYKIYDNDLHKKYTGKDNISILNNIRLLNELGKDMILRCPIIPTINDNIEHFNSISDLANTFENIKKVEIEPYHRLGEDKNLGIGNNVFFKCDIKPEKKIHTLINDIQPKCSKQIIING